MAVITVSRGSFSGGKLLAECLADGLGYRCVDRDVIVEKAAAYGVPQEELRNALTKPPTFWDRFRHKKYIYLTLIQAALAEEMRPGKAVYHGNAGHLLLRGVTHVVRTRIIAPMSYRLAAVKERFKLSDAEAVTYIQRMDEDRRKWTQYLYGVEWDDPALYDIVLNLEGMDVKAGCQVIAAAARLSCFDETPQSQAAMNNLALASSVRANLVMNPSTSGLEVDVTATDGSVSVKGRVPARGQIEEVRAVVSKVPGVSDVQLDLYSETLP
jgi:cytidylate kinase